MAHLEDLVRSRRSFDALVARQWVAGAQRAGIRWVEVPAPTGLDATELVPAAGAITSAG